MYMCVPVPSTDAFATLYSQVDNMRRGDHLVCFSTSCHVVLNAHYITHGTQVCLQFGKLENCTSFKMRNVLASLNQTCIPSVPITLYPYH